MNEQELILTTVGDLELQRRHLLFRISELEKENAELKAAQNGKVEEEKAQTVASEKSEI